MQSPYVRNTRRLHTCRFFNNNGASPDDRSATSGHIYGPSIFDVGVQPAWEAMLEYFSSDGFGQRGGVYEWGQSRQQLEQQRQVWQLQEQSAE